MISQELNDRLIKHCQSVLSLSKDIVELIGEKTDQIEDNLSNYISFLLYKRILDNFTASLLLINNKLYTQSRILIRCMIEPSACLEIISKDSRFVDIFIDNNKHEKKNLLNKKLKSNITLDKELLQKKLDALSEEIKNKKIKRLTATGDNGVLEKTELKELYISYFSILSPDVHSSVTSLYDSVDNSTINHQTKLSEIEQSSKEIPLTLLSALIIMYHALWICDNIYHLNHINNIREKHLEYLSISKKINENLVANS